MDSIYVIRHGKPALTWGGAELDPGLDDTGWAQARSAAAALTSQPPPHRPRSVVSSPLRRCRETAQALSEALGVELIIDAAVGEIPTPANLSAAERPAWLQAAFAGQWRSIKGDLDYEVWRSGVVAAVASYPGAAIFSHFVALNALVSKLQGGEDVLAFRPDHCSITTLTVAGGQLRLAVRGAEAATGIL